MNDSKTGHKTGATCSNSHKPAWWTDSLETSWSKVKAEAIQDFHKVAQCENNLEHRINAEALAFGHGAREWYHKLQVWSHELEDLLKADWKETGHRAECAWEKVRAAVRHGFEHAGRAARSAAAKPAGGAESPFLGGY